MVISKDDVQLMIDNQTIVGSGNNVSIASIDLSGVIDLSIDFVITFNAATNNGARIEMYSSPIDPEFTIGSIDDPCDVGIVNNISGTKKGSFKFQHSPKYAKFKVVNLGNLAITACSIWATPQKQ